MYIKANVSNNAMLEILRDTHKEYVILALKGQENWKIILQNHALALFYGKLTGSAL